MADTLGDILGEMASGSPVISTDLQLSTRISQRENLVSRVSMTHPRLAWPTILLDKQQGTETASRPRSSTKDCSS